MPENPPETNWKTVYKGETIFFCCNNCVDTFRRQPTKYLKNVPQLAHLAEDGRASTLTGGSGLMKRGWFDAVDGTGQGYYFILFGPLLFAVWRLVKYVARSRGHDGRTVRPVLVELLVCILLAQVVELGLMSRKLKIDLLKSDVLRIVHHATYYDHGFPPTPAKPAVPPRLSATYFRGNDERSDFLFNGGNYLTAQFSIGMERSDGSQVRHEDNIAGEPLFLNFTITRAPHSPDRLFGQKIMERIYLTRECGPLMGWESPIQDRLLLSSDDTKGHQWRARFPLGVLVDTMSATIDPQTVKSPELMQIEGVTAETASWFIAYRDAGYPIRGVHDLEQAGIEAPVGMAIASAFRHVTSSGIVYVCEANYVSDRQMGARFHYGLQYELLLHDGTILPESTVWMGSLSRSQKAAKGAIPDQQWLSSEPLPILPAPQNLSDQLLGLDDYPDL